MSRIGWGKHADPIVSCSSVRPNGLIPAVCGSHFFLRLSSQLYYRTWEVWWCYWYQMSWGCETSMMTCAAVYALILVYGEMINDLIIFYVFQLIGWNFLVVLKTELVIFCFTSLEVFAFIQLLNHSGGFMDFRFHHIFVAGTGTLGLLLHTQLGPLQKVSNMHLWQNSFHSWKKRCQRLDCLIALKILQQLVQIFILML